MKKRKLKLWYIGLILVVGFIAWQMVHTYPAEYFDKFGVISFAFLGGLGAWMLLTKKETPDWAAFLVLFISILGLIIDGFITFGGIK